MEMKNKTIYILIILALISSLIIGIQRHIAENQYRRVDLTIDLDELMGSAQGMDLKEVLTDLKKAGIHSVAVKEITLNKARAMGLLGVYSPSELRFLPGGWMDVLETEKLNTTNNMTLIITDSDRVFEMIKEQLIARFGKEKVAGYHTRDFKIISLAFPKTAELMNLELGFDFNQFDFVRELGLKIIPRIKNHPNLDETYIIQLFERLSEYPVSAIVFEGDEILGFPEENRLSLVSQYLRNYPFGLIETVTGPAPNFHQKGMEKVARLSGYNITRVFSLSRKEMKQLDPESILGKWSRCVERNNRIIYIKPIFKGHFVSERNVALTIEYVNKLKTELTEKGFIIEDVKTIPFKTASKFLLVLIVAGATAAGVEMIDLILPALKRYRSILFVVFFIPLGIMLFTPMWILDILLVALAISIIFPSVALIWFIREACIRKETGASMNIKEGCVVFCKVVGIALAGALLLAGVLSDIRFFMKLEYFRGVKLAFVVPLVMIWAGFMAYWGKETAAKDSGALVKNMHHFLHQHILVKHLAIIGIGGAVLLIYLLRSGNLPGFSVPVFEQEMRNLLETLLLVRPRTKEFLIGYPALVLLIWVAANGRFNFLLPLALLAGVGLISLTNTFSHLHIPIFISLLRTLYGIILGVVVGIAAVVMIWSVARCLEKIQEVLVDE